MRFMGIFYAAIAAIFATVGTVFAQLDNIDTRENLRLYVPSFDVRLSMGFNYDMLRSLTDVSFDGPMGYLGLNVPIPLGGDLRSFLGDKTVDDIFNSGMFRAGDNFKPTAVAGQNSNYTVRVDVPMLGGVGSFAYTQNFYFDFTTALGGTGLVNVYQDIGSEANGSVVGDDADISGFFALSGSLRLPLSIDMGWETMTFGYAYRVNNDNDLIFALNLHRHRFSIDTRLRADIDILGYTDINATVVPEPLYVDGQFVDVPPQIVNMHGDIVNFSSDMCNGSAHAKYKAEAWTPSIGIKWRMFSLDSRFGLKTKAKGSAKGGFVMPRALDLETGDLTIELPPDDEIQKNPASIFSAIPTEVDSISYEIGQTMYWELPQGHTLALDIIPNRLSLSYTKLFGQINLKIDDIIRTTRPESSEAGSWLDPKNDTLGVDVGVKIDHIIMFQLNYPSFFVNAGICGFEAWSRDTDGTVRYALRDLKGLSALRVGDVVMILPVLSGGLNLGTKLQLRLEADILPLPAIRTGVNYLF